MPADVAEVFAGYSDAVRAKLIELRDLIFETAAESEVVGELTETLKWGEPAYLTTETKIGSTIRLGAPRGRPECCALYFNCNTTLVESFRERFGDALELEGNRAVLFPCDAELPVEIAGACIEAALTYHLSRRERARAPVT